MTKKYKTYAAKTKAHVALVSMKENVSILKLCTDYKVPKTCVADWKNKLINEAENIFTGDNEKNKIIKNLENKLEFLHKIVGEMTVENKFLKKKLQL